jgi:hypothetical protein
MEAKVVIKDDIEELIQKRCEQVENGLALTDVRSKTLNLKVRA